MRPTRRELFRIVGASAAAAALPSCGDNRLSGVLSNDEIAMLEAFADVILPPDEDPGGAALGVVAYTERLLAAFAVPGAIPAIFGSGPFSDRNPLPGEKAPVNSFAQRVELDRVSDAIWRLNILGGSTHNEDSVKGLAQQLHDGFAEARAMSVGPIDELTADQKQELFDSQSEEFKSLLFDLTVEAAWAAPEYGGNPGGAGWTMVHFEGDSLPLGYTQVAADGTFTERADAPHSAPNPGPDPDPMTAEVSDLISTAIRVLGGREQ